MQSRLLIDPYSAFVTHTSPCENAVPIRIAYNKYFLPSVHRRLVMIGALRGMGLSQDVNYQAKRIYDCVSYNATTPRRVLQRDAACSKSFDEFVHLRNVPHAGRAPVWCTPTNSVHHLELDELVVTYREETQPLPRLDKNPTSNAARTQVAPVPDKSRCYEVGSLFRYSSLISTRSGFTSTANCTSSM